MVARYWSNWLVTTEPTRHITPLIMRPILYLTILSTLALGFASCEKDEVTPAAPVVEEPTMTPSEEMARDLDGYYTATRVEIDGVNYLGVEGGYSSATLDFDHFANDAVGTGFSLRGGAKWVFVYDGGREVVEGEYEINDDEADEMTFHSYGWPGDVGTDDSFFITAQVNQDYSENVTIVFTTDDDVRLKVVARKD